MRYLGFLISFFILFSFPIPFIYSSLMLAALLLGIIHLYDKMILNETLKLFKNIFFLHYVSILIVVILLGILTAILHLTFDFTALKANLLALISVVFASLAYPIIVRNIRPSERFQFVIKLIISLFLVQSTIEILAFLNSSIADIVHFFQKDEVANKNMGGLRALALTGNPFFDLSSGFAVAYLIFFFDLVYKGNKTLSLKDCLKLLLMFVGSFFAGRTSFIGLLIGLVFYMLSAGARLRKFLGVLKFLTITTLMSYLLYIFILPNDVKEIVEERLLPFAFEFVYSYLDSGQVTTQSTEMLDDMYFPISVQTFLFGDGYYTGVDGAYYLHTDAGIMRNILYYGLFGLVFMVVGHLSLFRRVFKKLFTRYYNVKSVSNFNLILFFFTLSLIYLILHYKGEVLLFLPIMQVLLVWIILSFNESIKLQTR